MRASVLVFLGAVAGAVAREARPRRRCAPPWDLARFQLCRAAVVHHLDGPADPAATVPRTVARTLLDQMHFSMAEALTSEQPASVDDAQGVLSLAETFFSAPRECSRPSAPGSRTSRAATRC